VNGRIGDPHEITVGTVDADRKDQTVTNEPSINGRKSA
jgi:hypothetical protein